NFPIGHSRLPTLYSLLPLTQDEIENCYRTKTISKHSANALRAPLALAVGHATRMATLLEVRTAISYQPSVSQRLTADC
ncbi:MAG: hypothetical protein F6K56_19975, partial [Moorea sp. SIO3G5]|nr:hypothetical protein [Moorena sp. SIO3G5]